MLLAACKRHPHVSVFSFSLKKPFPDVWDDPCKRLVLLQENCINWAASQHLSILTYLHYYSLHFYYKCICWHKHRFICWRTFMHSIYVHRHCIGGFHPRHFNESSKLSLTRKLCRWHSACCAFPNPRVKAQLQWGLETKRNLKFSPVFVVTDQTAKVTVQKACSPGTAGW